MNLKGKTFLVTGAAKGLGKAICMELANQGCNLILLDKLDHELFELKSLLEGKVQISCYTVDLNYHVELKQTLKVIKEHFEVIDGIINNAAVGIYNKPFVSTTDEEWNTLINVNITAVFLIIRELVPLLLNAKEKGYILNIGSKSSFISEINKTAYCTTKFALRGMTLTLEKEYEGTKLHVKLVNPGSILTGFGAISIAEREEQAKRGKKYLTPGEVAIKIVDVVKKDAAEVEVNILPGE